MMVERAGLHLACSRWIAGCGIAAVRNHFLVAGESDLAVIAAALTASFHRTQKLLKIQPAALATLDQFHYNPCMIAADLATQMLSLSDDDRAELAGILFDSLEQPDPNDFDSDSVTEAESRRAELDSGQATSISRQELLDFVQAGRRKS